MRETTSRRWLAVMDHLLPVQAILAANILSKRKPDLSAHNVVKGMLFKKSGKAKNSGDAAPTQPAISLYPARSKKHPARNAKLLICYAASTKKVTLRSSVIINHAALKKLAKAKALKVQSTKAFDSFCLTNYTNHKS